MPKREKKGEAQEAAKKGKRAEKGKKRSAHKERKGKERRGRAMPTKIEFSVPEK